MFIEMKPNTAKTAGDILRGAETILSAIILALSISLATRWDTLSNRCGPGPYDTECSKIVTGAGGMKYCIFVGVWGLVDVVVYLIDSFVYPLHLMILTLSSNAAGGFALGGGCTLAALINGWNCEAGKDGSLHLCHQIYANIAFLMTTVIVTWGQTFCMWHWKKNCPRSDSRSGSRRPDLRRVDSRLS